MALDFNKTTENFKKLLGLDWQENKNPLLYSASVSAIPAEMLTILQDCNVQFGYQFTPDAEGKSISIARSDRKTVSHAFHMGIRQTRSNPEKVGQIAEDLALHAYLEDIYHEAGVQEEWGNWSLEYKTGRMKTYKFSNHPHEKIVMNYMGMLFRLGAIKQRVSIKSAFIGMADFLKITPAKDMSKILVPMQQNIIDMVHVGKSTPENLTKTYEQITKSHKLIPYPHFEEAAIPARQKSITIQRT